MGSDGQGLPPAYRRLMYDGLIGASIRRVRGEAALDKIERDFHFWQNESVYPQYVNGLLEKLGRGNE